MPAHRFPNAAPCVSWTRGWIPHRAVSPGAPPSCLSPSSWSLPTRRSAGHVPGHQGLGLRSTDCRIVGTPSASATHGTRAVVALPPSLCAASRNGPLVPCAQLFARRSSRATHLHLSCTRASLACGSNLAPLGRSLALVFRFALSSLCARSSRCRDTAFSPMEQLALPIWMVSCLTPCLGSFHAPLGPPLLPYAPHFLSSAAESPTISLLRDCGPYGPPPPLAWGCLRPPPRPLLASSRSGTTLCTLFPPPSPSFVTSPRVLRCIAPLHHVLLSSLSASPPWPPPVPCATPLVCPILLAGGLLRCTRVALRTLLPWYLH